MSQASINDLERFGWINQNYEISKKDGFEKVLGTVKREIAVREQCYIEEIDEEGTLNFEFHWVVEHPASGKRIADFDVKWMAFQFAEKILRVPGWSEITRENPNMNPDNLLRVKTIRDKFLRPF